MQLGVDVMVVNGAGSAAEAKRATSVIPIVMAAAGDPVGAGVVASLAHPGGNVTGLSMMATELSAKRVELVKNAIPGLSRIAVLVPPGEIGRLLKATEAAARSVGMQVYPVRVRAAVDLDAAFQAAVRERAGAVITLQSPFFADENARIARLALKHHLPTMSGEPGFTEAGGLMTYGPSIPDLWRRAALYVDKILRGAKPGDLPIEQPTQFELVINLKTAKALGLTIPESIMLQANEVIR